MFAGDLAIALGCSLPAVLAMSAAEFSFWSYYFTRRGFPVNRIESAIALAGSAQCNAWGARVKPEDLIPKFGPRLGVTGKALVAALSSIPGAKVEYIPHKKV